MGYTEKSKIESDDAEKFIDALINRECIGLIVDITKEPNICDVSGKLLGYKYTAFIESYEM